MDDAWFVFASCQCVKVQAQRQFLSYILTHVINSLMRGDCWNVLKLSNPTLLQNTVITTRYHISEITNLRTFKFSVQGYAHRKLPFDIFPTKCNVTQFIYFWKSTLHVSGGISPIIRSTQLYLQYLVLVKPLLLPVVIVE